MAKKKKPIELEQINITDLNFDQRMGAFMLMLADMLEMRCHSYEMHNPDHKIVHELENVVSVLRHGCLWYEEF